MLKKQKKMKKKKYWITKAKKRKAKKEDRGIADLMRIMYHFLRSFHSGLMK